LFDYGFANFESKVLLSGAAYTEPVTVTELYNEKTVERGEITVAPIEDISYVLPKGTDISSTTVEMNVPETIEAPVTAGQVVGSMKVFLNGEYLKTVDLVTQDTVDLLTAAEKEDLDDAAFFGLIKKIGIGIGILLLLLILLICITRTIGYIQYQKRKKRRMERRRRERLHQERQKREMHME
ncbi:MAG: hypothetical protein Q4C06_03615, partial [Bacillota bacterium]|nr:hypothetical protein [Bacillota bacterium]